MNFSVSFNIFNEVEHLFDGGKYEVEEIYKRLPIPVDACIKDEEDQSLGMIKGYLLYNDCTFSDKCDNQSGDCSAIAEAICDKKGAVDGLDEYTGVFILDRIIIHEPNRGLGIGSAIMKNLLSIVQNQFYSMGAVVFYVSDFESQKEFGVESQEYKDGTERLIKFYEKCGYKVVKENVMFKSL